MFPKAAQAIYACQGKRHLQSLYFSNPKQRLHRSWSNSMRQPEKDLMATKPAPGEAERLASFWENEEVGDLS